MCLGRHLLVGSKDDLRCAKLQRVMLEAMLGKLTRLLLQNLRVKNVVGLLGLNSLLELILELMELKLLLDLELLDLELLLVRQYRLLLLREL